jgi:hypothetical protein
MSIKYKTHKQYGTVVAYFLIFLLSNFETIQFYFILLTLYAGCNRDLVLYLFHHPAFIPISNDIITALEKSISGLKVSWSLRWRMWTFKHEVLPLIYDILKFRKTHSSCFIRDPNPVWRHLRTKHGHPLLQAVLNEAIKIYFCSCWMFRSTQRKTAVLENSNCNCSRNWLLWNDIKIAFIFLITFSKKGFDSSWTTLCVRNKVCM